MIPRQPSRTGVRPRLPGARRAAALALACLVAAATAAGAPDHADAILDALVESMRGGGMRGTMTLTVERPDRTREYRLDSISDGAERALTRVVEPARDAGQAFLTLDDDLFVYTPRLGRVLRLPPSGRSDAFLGSDLSYEDLAGDELRDRFEARVVERGEDEVVLSLVPQPNAPTPYGELRFRASLPELAPLELVYADQRGADVKRILFEDLRSLPDGRLFPARMVVEDLTEGGGRTVARWTEAEFDVEPPDRCFTQAALERGC